MISVHTLKNGETVIVNNMEDIIDIVSEKLSEDLGSALKEDLDEFMFDIKDEMICQKMNLKTIMEIMRVRIVFIMRR